MTLIREKEILESLKPVEVKEEVKDKEDKEMKIFIGHVVATKSAKTATVAVERVIIHPLYKKRFRRDTKYLGS